MTPVKIDPKREAARDALVAQIESALPGDGPAPLRALRAHSAEQFAVAGIPAQRDEAWRHVDLRGFLKGRFAVPQGFDMAAAEEAMRLFTFENLEASRVVFVNGQFAEPLSSTRPLPAGSRVGTLREALAEDADSVLAHLGRHALAEDTPFIALNTALFADGAFISVPSGAEIAEPIHVLHLTVGPDPHLTAPRTLMVVGESAKATLMESFAGHDTGSHFTAPVTEVVVAAGANVDHLKLQREGDEAFHIAALKFHQDRDSNVFSNNITLGARLTRNDVGSRIDAEGVHCALDGLNLVSGRQWVDNHTLLDHAEPHCTSHQLYKSVLDEQATTVFNGRIIVRPDAQKTDAVQSNHSLLLSDDATAHTQPNLEIFADDVKCTHGATVGNLDETQLFYLRSRGISEAEGRGLLTFAFANEIIGEIKVEPVREQLEAHVYARFHRDPE